MRLGKRSWRSCPDVVAAAAACVELPELKPKRKTSDTDKESADKKVSRSLADNKVAIKIIPK